MIDASRRSRFSIVVLVQSCARNINCYLRLLILLADVQRPISSGALDRCNHKRSLLMIAFSIWAR